MRTGSYATKTHLIHKSSPKTDGDTLNFFSVKEDIFKNRENLNE